MGDLRYSENNILTVTTSSNTDPYLFYYSDTTKAWLSRGRWHVEIFVCVLVCSSKWPRYQNIRTTANQALKDNSLQKFMSISQFVCTYLHMIHTQRFIQMKISRFVYSWPINEEYEHRSESFRVSNFPVTAISSYVFLFFGKTSTAPKEAIETFLSRDAHSLCSCVDARGF